jgi:hypothetical protein
MATDNTLLSKLLKEQEETNRLLRILVAKHDHRWIGPDMDNPMHCRICGEVY